MSAQTLPRLIIGSLLAIAAVGSLMFGEVRRILAPDADTKILDEARATVGNSRHLLHPCNND